MKEIKMKIPLQKVNLTSLCWHAHALSLKKADLYLEKDENTVQLLFKFLKIFEQKDCAQNLLIYFLLAF